MATRLIGVTPPRFVAELLCIAATAVLIGHALCRDDPFRRIIAAHMLSWIGIQSLFIYLVPVIQQRMTGLDHAALGRSEERREGQEMESPGRYQWLHNH